MSERSADATRMLVDSAGGDERAAERLFPLVYARLRRLAGSYMKGERPSHTLQPTALVHEAYVRMMDVDRIDWRCTTHFFAVAARQMRRILVEHARGVGAQKRGGAAARVTLDEGLALVPGEPLEVLAIDEALTSLAERHERPAQVAELRLFSGMQVREIAAALDVSERTVKGDWRLARAWLMRALGGDADASTGDD